MLNIAIVDDELPARSRLRKLVEPLVQENRVLIAGEAGDGVEALELLDEAPVDLLLLDIRMPGMDGFALLERIPPDKMPSVIFTTAYDDYALKAFEANAIDYLLKPVSKERLEEAVSRAESRRRSPQRRSDQEERLSKLLDWLDEQALPSKSGQVAPTQEYARQISVPYRDRILVIPVGKVISAEISEGVTRVYVAEEDEAGRTRIRHHMVSHTLDQLESVLDPGQFMRVHRSAIVQIGAIQEMIAWFSGRYKLMLTGGHEVIASRERSRLLKDRLMI